MKQHHRWRALLLLSIVLLLLTLPVFATGQTLAGSEQVTTAPEQTTEAEGTGTTLSVPVVAAVIAGGAAVIALAVLLPNAIKVKKEG